MKYNFSSLIIAFNFAVTPILANAEEKVIGSIFLQMMMMINTALNWVSLALTGIYSIGPAKFIGWNKISLAFNGMSETEACALFCSTKETLSCPLIIHAFCIYRVSC